MNRKAMYFETKGSIVICNLCPHHCALKNNEIGKCRVRVNRDNILYTMNYGEVTSAGNDPIEKKPLYHFYPGTNIISLGTFGCNLKCEFCQNHRIAHGNPKSKYLDYDDLKLILEQHEFNVGIAFTYNEPTIWYEYIYDCVKKIKEDTNLKVVLVTNGFIEEEPLLNLLPYIDAMNIDLKSYHDDFYQDICKARLHPVLKTIEVASKHCHIEVTTLMVTHHVQLDDIEKISKFLSELNPDIPLHLSRYFPNYKMNDEPTDINLMEQARLIASSYLNYIYLGNLDKESNTYCKKCGKLLIKRTGYMTTVLDNQMECSQCGTKNNIVI
jgi:pyruvate formate lyase activating enzyme